MFNNDDLQWEIFAFQLQKELIHAKSFTKKTILNISYLTDSGDLGVKIGPGDLRREEGYQPLLFGVNSVNFIYSNNVLNTHVKFANRNERSRMFIVPNVAK